MQDQAILKTKVALHPGDFFLLKLHNLLVACSHKGLMEPYVLPNLKRCLSDDVEEKVCFCILMRFF